MVRIYGHSWPVRWGEKDEEKMVKVYSNCDEAELFLNGRSYGVKKRSSQDFPAAGLRWMLQFNEGENAVRVVATKGKVKTEDKINFVYQTEKWAKPVKLQLEKIGEWNGEVTLQVTLRDDKEVLCLDAVNFVRFGITGDGTLIDNQGTSGGSRYVQVYNGRAIIKVKKNNGESVVSVKSDGLLTAFINL